MATNELLRLVEEAGFVFRGRVARSETEADLGPAASGKTVVVEVEQVLRGTDVLYGLVGRPVVVVSDEPKIDPGAVHIFLTNCVSLGDPVVAREVARTDGSPETSADIEEAVRVLEELPLAERVAAANLIVIGAVTDSAPLDETRPPRSEHDPQWWVARFVVEATLKGRSPRKRIDVLFANSRDIAWYRSPKLHEGVSGVLLLHGQSEDEALRAVAPTVYEASHPLDLQPIEALETMQRLVDAEAQERQDG